MAIINCVFNNGKWYNASVSGTPTGIFASKNVGTAKAITLSGISLALTSDGAYIYAAPTYAANIAQASLPVTGLSAANKIYNTTTTATISGTAHVTPLGGDSVSVVGTPLGNFANKNVGTAKAVTLAGLTLSGADAANYQIAYGAFTANITQRSLTVGGLGIPGSRVYDTTTSISVIGAPIVSPPLAGDSISVSGTVSGSFANKNVGTAKAITLTGLILSGADAANYRIAYGVPTANITQRSLTVTGLSASNKVYDGTTSTTVTGTAHISPLGSDVVNITGTPIGSFANKNVGTAKAIAAPGLSLTGTDANNYSIAALGLTANITKAPLHVTANNVNVVFPTSKADLTYTYTGLIGGETSAHFHGNLARNPGNSVGSYSINQGDLTTTESNYDIGTFTPGTFNISAPTSAELVSTIPSSSNLLSSFTSLINQNSSISGNALSLVGSLGSMSASEAGTAVQRLVASSSTPASSNTLIDITGALSERVTTEKVSKWEIVQ